MDTLESTTQSFIVKVWVEEIAEETSQGVAWSHHSCFQWKAALLEKPGRDPRFHCTVPGGYGRET
jgi:hypothetical protein